MSHSREVRTPLGDITVTIMVGPQALAPHRKVLELVGPDWESVQIPLSHWGEITHALDVLLAGEPEETSDAEIAPDWDREK